MHYIWQHCVSPDKFVFFIKLCKLHQQFTLAITLAIIMLSLLPSSCYHHAIIMLSSCYHSCYHHAIIMLSLLLSLMLSSCYHHAITLAIAVAEDNSLLINMNYITRTTQVTLINIVESYMHFLQRLKCLDIKEFLLHVFWLEKPFKNVKW